MYIDDITGEAAATFRLGICCAQMDDKEGSIQYHQQYMNLCKRSGDSLGNNDNIIHSSSFFSLSRSKTFFLLFV